MHAYNSNNADSTIEHLGFQKALCILMGWNYLIPPDNSKSYQLLSGDEAAANQNDLIMWPPLVIIHNTMTGKRADGRTEGLGNKAMDSYLRGITHLCILSFLSNSSRGYTSCQDIVHLPWFLF